MNALADFGRHGGRLGAAQATFPQAPTPWLDLSTGINPRPWSGPRAGRTDLGRLPDPLALAGLERSAALAFGCAPERVCAVPGAEAGLRALPVLTAARSVAIAGPTYRGHEQAWAAAAIPIAAITASALERCDAEALVLVNPNNPDGAQVAAERLAALARARSGRGRWLIVDESFVETAPELSVAHLAEPGLIVLRSFGKFYGLAGLRLGFMIAAPEILAPLRERFGDWPVSAEAIAMGTSAYAAAGWRRRTLSRLGRDAERLDRRLAVAGFEPVGGTALFRLVRTPDAPRRFEALCAHGVLTRPFPHDPTWLRFGLPGAVGWARLDTALEASA